MGAPVARALVMTSSPRSVWTGWASGLSPFSWSQMAAGYPFRLLQPVPFARPSACAGTGWGATDRRRPAG
jgi:hypothetical protein